MSFFQAVVDANFNDPNMGQDALYTPGMGTPATIRVMARRPDAITDILTTKIQANTAMFDIRVSEVALPVAGDTITLGSDVYTVQNSRYADGDRLIWTVDTHPQ